jgi:hypothetical protein
LKQAGNVL